MFFRSVTFSRFSRLAELQVEQHLDHLMQRSVVLLQLQMLGEPAQAVMDVRKLPSLCLWFVLKLHPSTLDSSLVVSDSHLRVHAEHRAQHPPQRQQLVITGLFFLFGTFPLHAGLLQLRCCLLL